MILRKECFDLPEGLIYLDGNSLGALPKGAVERVSQVVRREWGQELIRAWNSAEWMSLPQRVGNKIARLIGAPEGSVSTGDTLSIKIFQALSAALKMRPSRKIVLSDNRNFPTDLYVAQGLLQTIDKGYRLCTPDPDQVIDLINEDVAAVMLTHVDYRSGRLYDMQKITRAAHAAGAVMIWDLAHSAGALPLELEAVAAEFAVGCTYKYLNGGPGAPAFLYARPDIVDAVQPALAGWMGHETPFAMDLEYRPAMSTERFRIGTPPVVQLAVLDAALDVWDGIDMNELRASSIALSELFIKEVSALCPGLELVSPRDPSLRGSQVSFAFEHGYAAMQALIENGVIGDFRQPNIMRFGFTPLYLDQADVCKAAEILAMVVRQELWRDTRHQTLRRVT